MPLVSTFGNLSARGFGFGAAAKAFTPLSLFAAGEQGVWYDPSDLTTMFEDSAGTTAVHTPGNGTADSPVGKILDKSGRGNHATQSTSTARPTLSARYNVLVATDTLSTQSVTTVAAAYTLSFSGSGTITLSGTKTGTYSSGSNSLTGVTAGTLTLTVSGTVTNADLRVTNDGVGLPAYQRVADANTYDSTGFPYYLSFDGVNRFMSAGDVADIGTATGQSTFTGTKIFGNDGTPYAKSLSNSAAYRYGLTRSGGTLYSVYAWGSNPSDQITPSVSDTTIAPRVLTVLIDRTVASNKVRANGTQIASATGTSTSDNFNSTYRFLVGAYNDTSDGGQTLYLNGRIYGLIVRNANSTATEISNTETWMNGKTKAY